MTTLVWAGVLQYFWGEVFTCGPRGGVLFKKLDVCTLTKELLGTSSSPFTLTNGPDGFTVVWVRISVC